MAYGLTAGLVTNMVAQAGKCKIKSIVFACDTEPTVVTQAPKKYVTLYPREIELENYEKLKKFKDVDVVDSIDKLKNSIELSL